MADDDHVEHQSTFALRSLNPAASACLEKAPVGSDKSRRGENKVMRVDDKTDVVASLILKSERVVALTGAGISTESGIPDFRSPGGIWSRYDPEEFSFQRFLASEDARRRYWEFSRDFYPVVASAKPNAAHLALAELYRLGKLHCIITQNVDGLHQKSGVPEDKVIEIHGTLMFVVCLDCGKKYPRGEIQKRVEAGELPPRCECGGVLKPATISFGQPMPAREMRLAEEAATSCDLFMVVGSSLVVYPAASLPLLAKRSGARLVIINLTPTAHDNYADVVIHGKASATLQKIVMLVKAKMRENST